MGYTLAHVAHPTRHDGLKLSRPQTPASDPDRTNVPHWNVYSRAQGEVGEARKEIGGGLGTDSELPGGTLKCEPEDPGGQTSGGLGADVGRHMRLIYVLICFDHACDQR